MPKILLICADPVLNADLKQQFELYDGWEVVEKYEAETVFDAAVVDNDAAAADDLHNKLLQTPLCLLWTVGNELPENGGIRVIRKPFRLEELLDALQAGINTAPVGNDSLELNGCMLDLSAKEIRYFSGAEAVKLTEREVAILKYLYKANGKIVSKAELLAEVWGYSPEATTHTVETHIYRLRQKVEQDDNGQIILTEENGYKLNLS